LLLLATAILPDDDAADVEATPPRPACIVSLKLAASERTEQNKRGKKTSR
jgi:hypothetical protein